MDYSRLIHSTVWRKSHAERLPYAPQLQGVGLSDEPLYAETLAKRLGYRNAFLHRQPQFDLTDPNCGAPESLDFLLATEVFEHIPPPVQPAFDHLAKFLKPNGFAIFSTPWLPTGRTVEHFPKPWSIPCVLRKAAVPIDVAEDEGVEEGPSTISPVLRKEEVASELGHCIKSLTVKQRTFTDSRSELQASKGN